MLFIFDLDGTLIDNEAAIDAAYHRAGVIRPPVTRLTGAPCDLSWCTPEEHAAKAVFYAEELRTHARIGNATEIYYALRAIHAPIALLTGASMSGTQASLEWLNISKSVFDHVWTGCTMDAKIDIIKHLLTEVVYIDSDVETASHIAKEASCAYLIPSM